MKNEYLKLLLFICLIANNSKVYSFQADSITKQCYHNEIKYTPIMVNFISNNQIDSVEMLFSNMPKMCEEQGWNQLISLFLVCVKYPEKIDYLNENEMDFIIDYTYCVRYNQFKYQPKDTIYYDYYIMPTFNDLHQAVLTYLTSFYQTLPTGSKQQSLVGTIINKNNSFFEELKDLNSYDKTTSTYASYLSSKEKLNNATHLFLHLNTSYSINNQIGNAIVFEYLGIEFIQPKMMTGISLGAGPNTTNPNFLIYYNNEIIVPQKSVIISATFWANYILTNKGKIKPYVGVGASIFDWQHVTPKINGKSETLSIFGGQVYPELGFLIGKKPNYWLKIHGSYRYTGYTADYWGDSWDNDSTFGHNIKTNDIRIGVTILFNLLSEAKHKGKIIGLN